jgi:hypothetical protein
MRYPILISIFLFVIFTSCNKDKFSTTPTLKFEKVSTKELHPGGIITFTLSFTYKGDLNGNIFVQELVPLCTGNGIDSINTTYNIPSFPASQNQKGEITVTYGYNVTGYDPIHQPQCTPNNDTAIFRFVLKDNKMHVSDTVSSPQVIIYLQ